MLTALQVKSGNRYDSSDGDGVGIVDNGGAWTSELSSKTAKISAFLRFLSVDAGNGLVPSPAFTLLILLIAIIADVLSGSDGSHNLRGP